MHKAERNEQAFLRLEESLSILLWMARFLLTLWSQRSKLLITSLLYHISKLKHF